jgi:UDP-glucose 4-epimerase
MHVFLTGGRGRIGKAVINRLLQKDWQIRAVDVTTGDSQPGVDYRQCDILDYAALHEAMRGCDAVIHLAALPAPMLAPASDTFQINVAGTYNVFEAASRHGIKRVVQASSINALGCAYNITDLHLAYLPIDEDHPIFTNDAYSFSKQIIEQIGDYYWRRDGISSVALRFPWVYPHDYLASAMYQQRRDAAHALYAELARLSDGERDQRLAATKQQVLAYRQQRPQEYETIQANPDISDFGDDPLFRALYVDYFNFWTFVDERDAAQAIEKSITAQYDGAHALFANDPINFWDYDIATLLHWFYPTIPLKGELSGSASLISIKKARQLIGFEPEFSAARLR